ncbi:hypothetical protein B0T26DRAFT_414207 [Lasiosphaeria miniovina]|uniref:Uncharacterized protein n=1 Tax=Lasiosphaeria miniovina TaxID=1954250 RepID=A0AA40A5P7_9PEZI|nr:uncharacterized protein B0T26DRAFT_414207 [Lasiosphaeria miniovina]KAK0709618.1 hypothetical protein B0T26DRAFT_414207 [Lasiosphaeria miniovina]
MGKLATSATHSLPLSGIAPSPQEPPTAQGFLGMADCQPIAILPRGSSLAPLKQFEGPRLVQTVLPAQIWSALALRDLTLKVGFSMSNEGGNHCLYSFQAPGQNLKHQATACRTCFVVASGCRWLSRLIDAAGMLLGRSWRGSWHHATGNPKRKHPLQVADAGADEIRAACFTKHLHFPDVGSSRRRGNFPIEKGNSSLFCQVHFRPLLSPAIRGRRPMVRGHRLSKPSGEGLFLSSVLRQTPPEHPGRKTGNTWLTCYTDGEQAGRFLELTRGSPLLSPHLPRPTSNGC